MTDTVTSTPPAPAPPPASEPHSTPRRVAANAFNPFAAQIVTKVLMLFYAIVQYRLIGGGAFALGDYFLAGLVFMYTSTIADWGLGTLLTREGAKARGTGTENEHVASLFGETLVLRLFISLALFVPVALFTAIYLTWFSLTPEGAWSIVILTVALIPGAFSSSVTALLFAYERMSLPAVIGIATSF